MERTGKILGTTLRGMKDPEAAKTWLVANWMAMAGKPVAAHTRPVAFRDGIFELQADSAEWKSQVENLKTILCERINHAWGGTLVRGIQIETQTRFGGRIPYAEDNSHTPFIRRPKGRKTL
jgi:predicted nucleic acid-binding Zn ribbon protein